MSKNAINQIENWYSSQCNGEWEHTFGVTIETLDNPGWSMRVDLAETPLKGVSFSPIKREVSEENWIHARVEEGCFVGFGGSKNLEELISIFTSWVGSIEES